MVDYFKYLVLPGITLLIISSLLILWDKRPILRKSVYLLLSAYSLLFLTFIVSLWIDFGRAPLRTLGETRLWYAFFIPLLTLVLYLRGKWRWVVPYGSMMAIVFLIINAVKPENFSKELMPALQSVWFAPHVIVYIFSYAIFGLVTLLSIHQLLFVKEKKWEEWSSSSDTLIYTGFAFLTLGLLFGAIWAKQAWGHYWTWDPKEVWALITWMIYLLYMHYRIAFKPEYSSAAKILIIAFILLLLCWFGINYMPIASQSVHTYGP
ncbi:MAG TPA: cytochrome c biogenesis protein CcsA [Bacteroidales bacterium]|nr:cytochrome c biogenesis protein CcsA [Bacteroidales bacterium]